MKQKAFYIIFKGVSIKQITNFCLEGESPTLRILKVNEDEIFQCWEFNGF